MVRVVFSVAGVLAVPAGVALSASCAASPNPQAPAPVAMGPETDVPGDGSVLRRGSGPEAGACIDDREKQVQRPVACDERCTAYTVENHRCREGRSVVERIEADCSRCPRELPALLAGCEIEKFLLPHTTKAPSDQCELGMRCGGVEFHVVCDGENDGTGTSLCDCERDGIRDRHALKPLYPGEAPGSCLAAAADCRAAAR